MTWQFHTWDASAGYILPEPHKPMCDCGATTDLWLFEYVNKHGNIERTGAFVVCDADARGRDFGPGWKVVALDDENPRPADPGWSFQMPCVCDHVSLLDGNEAAAYAKEHLFEDSVDYVNRTVAYHCPVTSRKWQGGPENVPRWLRQLDDLTAD